MNELEQILFDAIKKTDTIRLIDNLMLSSDNRKFNVNGHHYFEFVSDVLFDPEFGKKFWGEGLVCLYCGRHHTTRGDCDFGCVKEIYLWQHHFSQQVQIDSNEERIRYLKKGLV